MKLFLAAFSVVVFFLFLPANTNAQVASNSTTCLQGTRQGSCIDYSPAKRDQCNNEIWSCPYVGHFQDGTACIYYQDEAKSGTPSQCLTTVQTCTSSCNGRAVPFTVNGVTYQYTAEAQLCGGGSVCTGTDGNGCGFCQGYHYCDCDPNGNMVEIACDPRTTTGRGKQCGQFAHPCDKAWSGASLVTTCPVTPSTPACSFNSFTASTTSVIGGQSFQLSFNISNADGTKSCQWLQENPGFNTGPSSPITITPTNGGTTPTTKTYQLRCFNSLSQPCDSPPVPVTVDPNQPSPCTCSNWGTCNSTCNGTQTRTCSNCTSSVRLSQSCNTSAGSCLPGSCSLNKTNTTQSSATISISTTPPTGYPNNYNNYIWYICTGSNCTTTTFLGYNPSNPVTHGSLNPNTTYTVGAKAITEPQSTPATSMCTATFTTGQTSTPTGPLTCYAKDCFGSACEVGFWTNGGASGVYTHPVGATFNLPGTPNYAVGQGCWRPGTNYEPPVCGEVGGKIWVADASLSIYQLYSASKATFDSWVANGTLAPINTAGGQNPMGQILFWVWTTTSQCTGTTLTPMCNFLVPVGDGSVSYCGLRSDNQGGYRAGIPVPIGGGQSQDYLYRDKYLRLVSWDSLNYKPIGYYSFQHGYDRGGGWQCEPNLTDPNSVSRKPIFYYWGGWVCDGCGLNPGSYVSPTYEPPIPNLTLGDSNPNARYCAADNGPASQDQYLGGFAPSNAVNARIDWVFRKTQNITGTVFVDTDRDGVKDADETYYTSQAEVRLFNSSNTLLTYTRSDTSGNFTFADNNTGSYSVRLVTPDGYDATTPTTVTTTASGTATFGIAPTYSISGFVCIDLNSNNQYDAGEPAFFQPITVSATGLSNPSTTAYKETQSNGTTGIYSITSLRPGSYRLFATPPAGRSITTPNDVQVTIGASNPSATVNLCVSQISPWARYLNGDILIFGNSSNPGGPSE